MQSVLLIENSQLAHDDISQALAGRYVLQRVRDISRARENVKRGQLVFLAIADIHEHERICFLRELVVNAYKVIVILPAMHQALMRACALLGAKGLVENNFDNAMLMQKVDAVLNGHHTYISAFLSESLDFYYQSLPPLSRSHMHILNIFMQNPQAKNVEIGRIASLADGSVRNIFTALCRKFNVPFRFELIDAVIHRGYFIGFHLIFPRGFNKHVDEVRIVDGKAISRFHS